MSASLFRRDIRNYENNGRMLGVYHLTKRMGLICTVEIKKVE